MECETQQIFQWELLAIAANLVFLTDADVAALLRIGAPELSGCQLDFGRNCSTEGCSGIDVPLRTNGIGHYAFTVAPLR